MQLNAFLNLLEKHPDWLFLTPNRRLSSFIIHHYEKYQYQHLKKEAWATCNVYPIATWLNLGYENLVTESYCHKLLLSPYQESYLWEYIIQQNCQESMLINPRATAQLAIKAWHLVHQWQIPLQAEIFESSIDCAKFYQWALLYSQYCEQHNFIDNSALTQLLVQAIAQQQISLPSNVALVGFDEIPLHFQKLFQAFEERQILIHPLHLTHQDQNISVLPLANTDEEINTMAEWAKQTVLSYPDAYIACVVPNLLEMRASIESTFNFVFTQNSPNIPFNISGGSSLSCHPIIAILFNIYKLYSNPIEINTLSPLLLSPFIGYAKSESHERALLDLYIRNQGEQSLSLTKIIHFCEHNPLKPCPLLAKQLDEIRQWFLQLQANYLPFQWSIQLSNLLQLIGWPGERTLSSEEYQYVQRWQQLLHDFAKLSIFDHKLNYFEAITQLYNMASETLFQSQNKALNVQVLGVLEAAGTPFNYLWVMDMHDGNWPAKAKPNPFIPVALQRKLDMPHSSAQRELAFSTLMTERLTTSSQTIVFSYPLQQGEEILFPSPLIKNFAMTSLKELNLPALTPIRNELLSSIEWESVEDYYGPSLENDTAAGGTTLFKLQSQCAFKAFTELRLHAHCIENPQPGLSAQQRGTLLHQLLDAVWSTLKSQQKLLELSQQQLERLLDTLLKKQLLHLKKRYQDSLQKQFLAIEEQRLKKLLLKWLDYERQRPPFRVIATELKKEVTISGLKITFKIDRIDELENGAHCIIDYKSNKPSVLDWFSPRPLEPQLPLYWTTHSFPVAAITFAQVRSSEVSFIGISAEELSIPNIRPINTINHITVNNWHEQYSEWQQNLTQLANQFQSGFAVIDPKEVMTCDYCQLETLCRRHELEV